VSSAPLPSSILTKIYSLCQRAVYSVHKAFTFENGEPFLTKTDKLYVSLRMKLKPVRLQFLDDCGHSLSASDAQRRQSIFYP
jgi:hypothetical protein